MGKTVLIADDDSDLVQILSTRCGQLGLRVISASDATDALYAIDIHEPDLVCLDVNMPGGSGMAVCEMLATDELRSTIPVVILTGRADDDIVRRCHNLRAYHVLKSDDVWQRMKPLICELSDISWAKEQTSRDPLTSGRTSTCQEAQCSAAGLPGPVHRSH